MKKKSRYNDRNSIPEAKGVGRHPKRFLTVRRHVHAHNASIACSSEEDDRPDNGGQNSTSSRSEDPESRKLSGQSACALGGRGSSSGSTGTSGCDGAQGSTSTGGDRGQGGSSAGRSLRDAGGGNRDTARNRACVHVRSAKRAVQSLRGGLLRCRAVCLQTSVCVLSESG